MSTNQRLRFKIIKIRLSDAASSTICSQRADSQPDALLSQRPDSQMSMASTQVLTQFSGSKMSTKIRAHAFITLGRLVVLHDFNLDTFLRYKRQYVQYIISSIHSVTKPV